MWTAAVIAFALGTPTSQPASSPATEPALGIATRPALVTATRPASGTGMRSVLTGDTRFGPSLTERAATNTSTMPAPTARRVVPRPRQSLPARAAPEYLWDDVQAIRERHKGDPKASTRDLLKLWKEHDGCSWDAILAACQDADAETAVDVVSAVEEVLSKTDVEQNNQPLNFFVEPATELSGKMVDHKPLLDLAMKYGCWEMAARYRLPAIERDKCLLQGIRQCRVGSMWTPPSFGLGISAESIPALRAVLKELQATPNWEGFSIAAATLAQLDDEKSLPVFEETLQNPQISRGLRASLKLYSAKLKYQQSPDDLFRLLREERTSDSVLEWAVKRLLWLKADKQAIYEALSANRAVVPGEQDMAAIVESRLRQCDGKYPSFELMMPEGDLVLDSAELRESYRSETEAVSRGEKPTDLSLYGLMKRASSKEK